MSQVVYRGTAYDTVKRRQAQSQEAHPHNVKETYRGVSYTKEVR
jgi:hypothetical protein